VRRSQLGGKTIGIPPDLWLDAREGEALLLGFERADGSLVDKQQVVGVAVSGLHLELPDGHTAGGAEVDFVPTLDRPARGPEPGIDSLAGSPLRRVVGGHSGAA